MNHSVKTKIMAALLSLFMIVTLLPVFGTGVSATGYLADGDCSGQGLNVEYNYGDADITCTTLSDMAASYYTSGYSYEHLSQLQGSATQPSSSVLYVQLANMMQNTQTKNTSYEELKTYYEYSDCEDGQQGYLRLFYSGAPVNSSWSSNRNREHVWPKSNAVNFGSSGETNGGSDLHHLRPTDPTVNSTRGNMPFGNAGSGATEVYGPSGSLAAMRGSSYFEPVDSMKGDCARIILYVFVRWDQSESNLAMVFESIDVLLDWMESDPVSTWEMGRNDVVEGIEGNRNVFIDYPELAFKLFDKEVPENYTTPSSPSGTSVGGEVYNISYYVNGTLATGYGAEYTQVNSGSTITLPTGVTAPEGYVFCGWVEEAITTATDVAPVILKSFKPTGDTSLHALFAVESAGTGGGDSYKLIKDAGDLKAGDKFILVAAKSDGSYYAAGALSETSTTYLLSVSIDAPAGEVITQSNAAIDIFTLGGSSTGWAFTSTLESADLGWSSGNSATYSATGDKAKWTVATASDGKATITNVGDTTRMLQYNVSSPRFASYTTAQTKPFIYRQEGGTTLGGYITNIGTVPPVPTTPPEETSTPIITDTPVPTGTPEPTSTPEVPITAPRVYTKVTGAPTDWSGEYLIVYENEGLAYVLNGSLTTLDASSNFVEATIANDTITMAADAAPYFTIAAKTDGYSILSRGKLYIGNTSNSNTLKSSATDEYVNAISYNSADSCVDIVSATTYLRYNKTSGQDRFRYYKSSSYTNQQAIQLYKYSGVAADSYAVSFTAGDGGTVTVEYDGNAITDGAVVPKNGVITVTATANQGYELTSLTLNGEAFTSGSTHTVTAAVEIAASFAAVQQYSISWEEPTNGSIEVMMGDTPVTNGSNLLIGSTITIYASPAKGYFLESLTVNGAEFVSGYDLYVGSNMVIAANFVQLVYENYELVTDASQLVSGAGYVIAGSKEGSTEGTYDMYVLTTTQNNNNRGAGLASSDLNAIPTTLAVPNSAAVQELTLGKNGFYWTFLANSDDGDSTNDGYLYAVNDSTNYLRTDPDEPVSSKAMWNITSGEGGSINIENYFTHFYIRFNGSNNSLLFGSYSPNSSINGPLYLYRKVDDVDPDSYAVNFTASEGGTVTVEYDGNAITSGTLVPKDGVITVTATANFDCRLESLTLNGEAFTSGSTHTVTSAVDITASFAAVQQYSISWEEPTNGSIEVMAGSTPVANGSSLRVGSIVTIYASPAEGYFLESLTANGAELVSGYDLYVGSNMVIAATFVQLVYQNYELVTDASQLVSGDSYVIAGSKEGSTEGTYDMYVLTTTQNTNNRGAGLASSDLNAIPTTLTVPNISAAQELTLGYDGFFWNFLANSDDGDSTNDGYLCSDNEGISYLGTNTETPSNGDMYWHITTGNSGSINIASVYSHYIRFNVSNDPPLFVLDASGSLNNEPLYLYRKVDGITVAFTAGGVVIDSCTVTAGGTLDAADIPAVPAKTDDPNHAATDYAGWWSMDLATTPITENIVVTAVYRLWGDADGDNSVTSADAVLLLRHIAGLETLDERACYVCDVDGAADGLSVVDASALLRRIVNLITIFDVAAN